MDVVEFSTHLYYQTVSLLTLGKSQLSKSITSWKLKFEVSSGRRYGYSPVLALRHPPMLFSMETIEASLGFVLRPSDCWAAQPWLIQAGLRGEQPGSVTQPGIWCLAATKTLCCSRGWGWNWHPFTPVPKIEQCKWFNYWRNWNIVNLLAMRRKTRRVFSHSARKWHSSFNLRRECIWLHNSFGSSVVWGCWSVITAIWVQHGPTWR